MWWCGAFPGINADVRPKMLFPSAPCKLCWPKRLMSQNEILPRPSLPLQVSGFSYLPRPSRSACRHAARASRDAEMQR